MPTNSELIDRVALRLGSRTNPALRPKIVIEVNAAIELLEQASFLPWFLQDYDTTLATITSTDTINLPANFLREIEEAKPWFVDTENDNDRVELKKREVDFITKRNRSDVLSYPQVYAIRNTKMLIGPACDRIYTINFPYYKASGNPLADNGSAATNPWLIKASAWVLNLAGSIVAGLHLQNPKLAQQLQGYAGAARTEMLKSHTAREMQNWDDNVDKFAGEK